ncbi:MAG: M24 family metallopeptidase, partial [Candidatus Bipolaricaulia bacterium]
DRAFEYALEIVKPGMSEREVAWELEKYMRENGSDGVAFPLIAAAGPSSALPHATPSEGRIEKGDLLLLDIGARHEGYCADLTRVISVGKPSQRQMKIYEVVRGAQGAALAGIRPGMTAIEADLVAREAIREAGFGDQFGHGLGHGVGLAVHEGPRLSPFADPDKDRLEPGMVVTVEPGIYLVGEFGVRIEDLCIVREDGLENLTGSPTELQAA